MVKPIIGLVPLWDDDKQSLWMLPGYMDGIAGAGGIPLMLPLTDDEDTLCQLAEVCDGVLLTGGHDVDPALYGEAPTEKLGPLCPHRDRMEARLLSLALDRNLPVLGICRGVQFLNAALGGTLIQDIPTQFPSAVNHHQTGAYDHTIHEVTLPAGTPLNDLLKKDRLAVNSYHHQGIGRLSPRLKPMAVADDGLTEAVWMPDKGFVWGVQWHPEFFGGKSEDENRIFAAFTAACAQKGKA